MIRWRALLIRTGCSYLLLSGSWTKGLENKVAYAQLQELGFHHEVCGICDEPFERVEAEAENLSAASENPSVSGLSKATVSSAGNPDIP